jgi:hypothetical protein
VDSSQPNSTADIRTLVVLSGTVAVTLGGVYGLLRAGFENPVAPILNSVCLSLFLTIFPFFSQAVVRRVRSRNQSGWATSYPFLWLLGFAITGIAGRAVPVVGLNLLIAFAVVGLAGFAFAFVKWVMDQGALRSIAYLVSGVAFGCWTAGVVWGRIYKNPLFVESLIIDGSVHHDTLYLASLGNMLRTYGTASTGIDGLNYVPYHWGSAWLFAQWSNLIGIDPLQFYQLTFPVTIIPFFFGGVIALAIFLRDRRPSTSDDRAQRLGGVFWAVFIAIAIGIAPLDGMEAMGVWTSNILISESYTIALPAALLIVALIIRWADGVSSAAGSLSSAPLRKSDLLFLLVVYPAALVLLGYLKISLMALMFAVTVFLFVRLELYRRMPYAAAMVISAVAFYVTYKQVSLPAHREGYVALDYVRSFVPPPWWPFFLLVHLLWTWVYAVFRCRQENVRDLAELWTAVSEGRLLDVELIVGLALVGVMPGMIMHIDGGSAFYFSDVQRWLAGAFLLSWIAGTRRRFWRGESSGEKRSFNIGAIPTRSLLAAFLIVPAAGSVLSNAVHWPAITVKQNANVRGELYRTAGNPGSTGRMRDVTRLRNPAVIAAGLRAGRNYTVVHSLEAFQALPAQSRRHLALFIPQDDGHFWSSLTRPGACTFQSLMGPALSGIALVDGMPAVGCQLSKYYGMGSFTPRTRAQTPADTTTAALCGRARAIGADTVIVLRFPGDSAIRRDVACTAAVHS